MVVLWGYGLGGTGAGGAEKSDPCEIDENTPDKRYCGIYDITLLFTDEENFG